MNLVNRARNIILKPREEWHVIDAEPLDLQQLLTTYVIPLAAIGPIATFIGWTMFGVGGFVRLSVGVALQFAILSFIAAIAGVFIIAWIVNALAPTFGAQQSMPQSIKLAAYGATASWLAAIFGLIPALAFLSILGLYSLYLLYVGLPILMKAPQEKVVPYLIAVIVAAVVSYVLLSWIVRTIAF
ncbi:Yip1 family protein [soil metagenome]